MDFAWFGSDIAYLELYFSRKCETEQTYKQSVKQLQRRQEIPSSHDHEIRHHMFSCFESVVEQLWDQYYNHVQLSAGTHPLLAA